VQASHARSSADLDPRPLRRIKTWEAFVAVATTHGLRFLPLCDVERHRRSHTAVQDGVGAMHDARAFYR
jgi:hypothetical protein